PITGDPPPVEKKLPDLRARPARGLVRDHRFRTPVAIGARCEPTASSKSTSVKLDATVDVDGLARYVVGGGEIDRQLSDVIGRLRASEGDERAHIPLPRRVLGFAGLLQGVGQVLPHLRPQNARTDRVDADSAGSDLFGERVGE